MKISDLHIKNFRSIEELQLNNIDNLTYLVGRNNAGKSNILKALLTFFNNKITSEDFPKHNEDEFCEIRVDFTDLTPNIKELLSLEDDVKKLEIKKEFSGTKTPKIFINEKEIAKYKSAKEPIRDFRDKFHKFLPLYYYIPALRNLKDEEAWKSNSLIKSLLEPLIKETASPTDSVDYYLEKIKQLIIKESKQMNENINEFLKDRLDDFEHLDISINNVDVSLKTQLTVTTTGGQEVSASEQGAGSQNFIILALAQHHAHSRTNRALILAFEEPEISLHPQGQRSMSMAIQSLLNNDRSIQIFLTTHSSVMLGQEKGKILLVRKNDEKTVLNSIDGDFKDIVDELGITGGDIFQSDALIFVEGRSDYLILKQWSNALEKRDKNSLWNSLRITFIHLDGTFGLKEYDNKDFKQLATCSNLFAILDSDRTAENQEPTSNVMQAKQKIEKAGGQAFILQYRAIESYFTQEAALRVLDLSHLGKINPYDDVKEFLKKACDFDMKKYRASVEGHRIAKYMAGKNQIPKEIEEILNEIATITAKRVGYIK